jgi:YD repeat-containing protein
VGFMDKAKKLAEQAQEKLDDAQKNFNQGQGQGEGQGQPQQVRYDQQGRPITEDAPPAGTAPPPSGQPVESPAPDPTAQPPAEPADPTAEPSPPPADKPEGGTETNPDPFKPIQ